MKYNIYHAVSATVALALLPSCTYRIADLTFASTKNIDMNRTGGYVTSSNARVTAKDTSHIVFVSPISDANPKEAIDKAVEQAGTDCVGLSNAVLYAGWWYIPFIYGQSWFRVEGDPVFKH